MNHIRQTDNKRQRCYLSLSEPIHDEYVDFGNWNKI